MKINVRQILIYDKQIRRYIKRERERERERVRVREQLRFERINCK